MSSAQVHRSSNAAYLRTAICMEGAGPSSSMDTQWTLNGHSLDTTMDTTLDTANLRIERTCGRKKPYFFIAPQSAQVHSMRKFTVSNECPL